MGLRHLLIRKFGTMKTEEERYAAAARKTELSDDQMRRLAMQAGGSFERHSADV